VQKTGSRSLALAWPRAVAWPAGLVVLLIVVAYGYGRSLGSFFVSDDLDMLAGDATDLLSPASGFGRFMPLAAAVHRAVAASSGLDPLPAHALQLALHLACTLLVYALAWRLVDPAGRPRARWIALAAAALFALYPRHHQVVLWFGAVSIGLASTLALGAALAFLCAWRGGDARAGWASVVLGGGALLAHESAVALPGLLVAIGLYEASRARRPPFGRPPAWLWAGAGLLALHLALLAWAYRARAAAYPDSGYRFLGLGGDLLVAPLRYAAQLLVPPPWTEVLAGDALGLAVGAMALLAAALWFWRGGALARLGLAWAALAAAPFVLFGVYGVADRYYYLASAGLALAAATSLARWPRALAALVGSLGVAGVLLLGQASDQWWAAGRTTETVLSNLAAWSRRAEAGQDTPDGVLFVGAPFKRGERWPGSQVYVFSTGLAGAAHLATGWPALRVSYVFHDEYPSLARQLGTRLPAPGPAGLYLFALDDGQLTDLTDRLGGALSDLAALHWRGASRAPVDWDRYAGAP